ncbi:MAG: mycofactocin biosynthesis chaperone MftB [Acidimicrobiales bacterium]
MTRTFDAAAAWELAPGVALREEDFGALAYDSATRHLTFLRSAALATLVGSLARYPSADAALDALADPSERPALATALAALARRGVLRAR